MKLTDCTPGKAVYHNCGFYAIISGQTKKSHFTGKILVRVIKAAGNVFWAYPESMTEHLPNKR